MEKFNFFTDSQRQNHLNPRAGETKFGEKLRLVSSFEALEKTEAQYVIFGIPEDVGIRGNFGKPGAATTWDSFLDAFLNIQANTYNTPENCVVLGHVDCQDFMAEAEQIMNEAKNPQEKLGPIAAELDNIVSNVVKSIVSVEKTPVIIGGGHNNAYGNIKGTAEAKGKAVNILNIDAHTDLRRTDYRHSGNGFSFAKANGYMDKYAMFGIHKNYTPQYIFDQSQKDPKIKLTLFEDLINSTQPQENQFTQSMAFVDKEFGLEIDCDAIEGFSSSALTPSGFSINTIRRFITTAKKEKAHYLHLCEAAAKGNPQIGKALSYFVSDFIAQ